MKKVIRYLIIFSVIIITFLPTIYTNTIYGYLPGIALVIFSLASSIYLLIIRRSITVLSDNENAECTRGENIVISMKVSNKSFFVCSKVKAEIFVSDYFGNTDSLKPTVFSLDSKAIADFRFSVKMEHVGVYTVGIRHIRAFGLMGIFNISVPFEKIITVTVIPRLNDIDSFLSDEVLTDSPIAKNYTENDGFDYTGVREYALGDSMKKIHWKLSAHSLEYMTKINESGKKSDMTVVLDTVSSKYDNETLLFINDSLIEMSASLVEQAKKKEIDYQLLFADSNRQIVRVVPRDIEDYAELVRRIAPITCDSHGYSLSAEDILNEEMQYANRSANICICTAKMSESLLNLMVTIKGQQRSPILYCFIKPGASSSQREVIASKLKALEEKGIYYEVISK